MRQLTVDFLKLEAQAFGKAETAHHERTLFGVTDGKAVGTYFEHKFQRYLRAKYQYTEGSSAKGIDFPELGYLTISNALQWRLQYSRVIEQAGKVEGVQRIA